MGDAVDSLFNGDSKITTKDVSPSTLYVYN